MSKREVSNHWRIWIYATMGMVAVAAYWVVLFWLMGQWLSGLIAGAITLVLTAGVIGITWIRSTHPAIRREGKGGLLWLSSTLVTIAILLVALIFLLGRAK